MEKNCPGTVIINEPGSLVNSIARLFPPGAAHTSSTLQFSQLSIELNILP